MARLLLQRAAILQLTVSAVVGQPRRRHFDESGLFQSSHQVRTQVLESVENTPPFSLEGADRSKLVTKLLGFLQGPRFHRSFQLLNNVSSDAQDLVRDIHREVGSLKTGLAAPTIQESAAVELLAKFFQKQRQAAEVFANTMEVKMNAYLGNLTEEDKAWVVPLIGPVAGRVKDIVAPMVKHVELVSGAASAASMCHAALTMMEELDGMDTLLRDRVEPGFNATTSLLPTLEISSSKGRMKMLRRFSDLGYNILEKVRSALVAQRSLAPALGKSLHCVSDGETATVPEAAAVLTQGTGVTSQAEPPVQPAQPVPPLEAVAEAPTLTSNSSANSSAEVVSEATPQERSASCVLAPQFFTVLALLAATWQS